MFTFVKRFFSSRRPYYCFLPMYPKPNYDIPDPDTREPDRGWEKVALLFKVDKFGETRKEMTSYIQIVSGNAVILGLFAGMRKSKESFHTFVEMHQHSRFISPYEMKRKLHDYVAMHFIKDFALYAFKGAFISGCFMMITMVIASYRGYDGILEYVVAGTVTGALMRLATGWKAMMGSGLLGLYLGTFVGCVLYGLSKISGTSLDDLRVWQKNIHKYFEEMDKPYKDLHPESNSELLDAYRKKIIVRTPEEEADLVYVVHKGSNVELENAVDKQTPVLSESATSSNVGNESQSGFIKNH